MLIGFYVMMMIGVIMPAIYVCLFLLITRKTWDKEERGKKWI